MTPHSVVWTGTELIDVTLPEDQLRDIDFFTLDGDTADFVTLAKRYPRESGPVAAELQARMGS